MCEFSRQFDFRIFLLDGKFFFFKFFREFFAKEWQYETNQKRFVNYMQKYKSGLCQIIVINKKY